VALCLWVCKSTGVWRCVSGCAIVLGCGAVFLGVQAYWVVALSLGVQVYWGVALCFLVCKSTGVWRCVSVYIRLLECGAVSLGLQSQRTEGL